MLDWLIIGGGVHGTHLSRVLTSAGKVPADRLRVLDPAPVALARWRACTAATGMRYLRSPSVHNLDLGPFALDRFARTKEGRPSKIFYPPYERPGLALFNAHCDHLLAREGLAALRLVGRAQGLSSCEGGMRVETDQGQLTARRVLLAISASESPAWPAWAQELRDQTGRAAHVFDPSFARPAPADGPFVVVGGGLSAVQLALSLAEEAPGQVTLLARHPVRVHQFDSDPGWLGPRYLGPFGAEPSYEVRRRMITAARHRGSVPQEVERSLAHAKARGTLRWIEGEVSGWSLTDGDISLELRGAPGSLRAGRVLLATGFDRARPGGAWLDRAIHDLGLRCAGCGYPIVDRALRWHPHLYVSGPLAELALGAAARNIAGARMTAERLLAA